jgi:hypothetical protein
MPLPHDDEQSLPIVVDRPGGAGWRSDVDGHPRHGSLGQHTRDGVGAMRLRPRELPTPVQDGVLGGDDDVVGGHGTGGGLHVAASGVLVHVQHARSLGDHPASPDERLRQPDQVPPGMELRLVPERERPRHVERHRALCSLRASIPTRWAASASAESAGRSSVRSA